LRWLQCLLAAFSFLYFLVEYFKKAQCLVSHGKLLFS
jgi:hypothetical protein